MTITKDRAEKLAEYLNADKERTVALLSLTAEEAAAKINKDGFDFTAEELMDFDKGMQYAAACATGAGELSEENLEVVAGGVTGLEVMAAMGLIYGAYEACKWAWDTGTWLGNQYINWRRKRR